MQSTNIESRKPYVDEQYQYNEETPVEPDFKGVKAEPRFQQISYQTSNWFFSVKDSLGNEIANERNIDFHPK